jgi:hypothetical protein
MNHPATCLACGTPFHYRETSGARIYFACSSYTYKGSDGLAYRTDECHYRQAIREAAAVIREMVDEWGNAMDAPLLVKAEEWLKDNAP